MRRILLSLPLLALLPAGAAATVRLDVATVDAEAGERVSVEVRLTADAGEPVVTIGNDILFDPALVRVASDDGGDTLCAVEDGIPSVLAAFIPQPAGCDLNAGECIGVRAVVLQFTLNEAPVERVIYRCDFDVADDAPPGIVVLRNDRAAYSIVTGVEGTALGGSGAIVVARDRIPSATPSHRSPTPTGTPTPVRRPPRVLDPGCTGDCDASGSVDSNEEEMLATALFDARVLAACVGAEDAEPARVGVAHLLRAVRAREQGCERPTPTPTLRRPSTTRTPTATRTPPPPSPSATVASTEAPAPTSTPRPSRSATRTPTSSRTPRPSATITRTRARTPSRTATPTRVPRTSTPTPGTGPLVTFAGVARGDGRLVPASGEADGVPIFDLASGTGFYLVVEGRPGSSVAAVGRNTLGSGEPPDLQLLASNDLGDGSARVCSGGVPGMAAFEFDDSDTVIDALNDLACHFSPVNCVLFNNGTHGFVEPQSTVQFCGLIQSQLRFERGETTVRIRLRDQNRMPSEVARLIVRVG